MGGGQPLDGAGSVAKKVRKGGIGSALRPFLFLGPHLVRIGVKKWAFSPPGIKEADLYKNPNTIFII